MAFTFALSWKFDGEWTVAADLSRRCGYVLVGPLSFTYFDSDIMDEFTRLASCGVPAGLLLAATLRAPAPAPVKGEDEDEDEGKTEEE